MIATIPENKEILISDLAGSDELNVDVDGIGEIANTLESRRRDESKSRE